MGVGARGEGLGVWGLGRGARVYWRYSLNTHTHIDAMEPRALERIWVRFILVEGFRFRVWSFLGIQPRVG